MLITSQGKVQEGDAVRNVAGSSAPSDVWALGCLLYELITTDLIFYLDSEGYPKFHATVTDPQQVSTGISSSIVHVETGTCSHSMQFLIFS